MAKKKPEATQPSNVGASSGSAFKWEQEYKTVPINDLRPHDGNPNRGDVEAIKGSIGVNGWFGAVLVQRSTMRIIAGEHRWRALRDQGAAEVPAILINADDATVRRMLLADNQFAKKSKWNNANLALWLEELALEPGGLDGTGFTEEDASAVFQQALKDAELGASNVEAEVASFTAQSVLEGQESEPPASHVRMVQLFLTTKTPPWFMERVERIKERYGKDNVTDAVIEAVGRTFDALGEAP